MIRIKLLLALLTFSISCVFAQRSAEDKLLQQARDLAKEMDEKWYLGADSGMLALKKLESLGKESSNKEIQTHILIGKGSYEYSMGNYENAENYYQQGVQLIKDTTFHALLSDLYLFLGRLHMKQAEYASSKQYFDLSYEYAIKSLNILSQTYIMANLVEYFIATSQADSAFKYLQKNHSLILKLKEKNLLISSYFLTAQYFLEQGDRQTAFDSLAVGNSYIEEDSSIFKANFLMLAGKIHEAGGQFSDAMESYENALKRNRIVGSKKSVIESLILLGELHNKLANYDLAMVYLVEAYQLAEETKSKADISLVLSSMGMVLKNEKSNNEDAKSYLWRSLELNKDNKYPKAAYRAHNSLGLLYLTENKLDSCAYYLDITLVIAEKSRDFNSITAALHNLGLLYRNKGDYNKALSFMERSLNMERKIGNLMGITISYSDIGNVLKQLGRFNEAIYYLKQAEAIALENNYLDELYENYLYQSEYFKAVGDFSSALDFFVKHKAIGDEQFRMDKARLMNEIKGQYDLGRKEKEIEILNQANLLKEQELQLRESIIRNQKELVISIIAILIILTIAGFIGIRYFRLKSMANEELIRLNQSIMEKQKVLKQQADELLVANERINKLNENLEESVRLRTQQLKEAILELDTFFYRSSHDFRRPITTLLGLSQLINSLAQNDEIKQLTGKIDETVLNLDKMIRKIQSFGNLNLELDHNEEVDIEKTIKEVLKQFENDVLQKNARIRLDCSYPGPWLGNRLFLEVLMENLLENSLAFGSRELLIDIKAELREGQLKLTISDNGQGIEEKYQSRIFDMFFRANESSKGNGLGLYLVKKSIDHMGGKIHIRSQVNVGTEVEIVLPEQVKATQLESIFV